MKSTFKKYVNNPAAYVAHFRKFNDHPQRPITLSMIGMELENDLMKLRSRCATIITLVIGVLTRQK